MVYFGVGKYKIFLTSKNHLKVIAEGDFLDRRGENMHLQKIKLSVMFLKEGKRFVACSPALDISTSAPTFKGAKKRFEELVDIYFEELVKMGTLEDVLAECGWRKVNRHYVPPRFISKIDETFEIPCPS